MVRGSLGGAQGGKSLGLVQEVNPGDADMITGGQERRRFFQETGAEREGRRALLLGGVWRRPLLKLVASEARTWAGRGGMWCAHPAGPGQGPPAPRPPGPRAPYLMALSFSCTAAPAWRTPASAR